MQKTVGSNKSLNLTKNFFFLFCYLIKRNLYSSYRINVIVLFKYKLHTQNKKRTVTVEVIYLSKVFKQTERKTNKEKNSRKIQSKEKPGHFFFFFYFNLRGINAS